MNGWKSLHKVLWYVGLMVCGVLLCSSAWAGICRSGMNSTAMLNIDIGAISEGLSQPVPVGGILAARSGNWDSFGGHNSGWCQVDVNDATRMATLASFNVSGSPATGHIYPTNLRGVGVRISVWSGGNQQAWASGMAAGQLLPFVQTANLQSVMPQSAATVDTSGLMIKVELIKTDSSRDVGPLTFSGDLLTLTAAGGSGGPTVLTRINLTGTSNVRTCAVVGSNIAVNMGTLDTGQLNRDGASRDVPLSIQLMCQNRPKVSVQFDESTAEDATAGVVSLLRSSGRAQGVGVQLRDTNGQPVPLGRPVFMGTPASDGAYSLNFRARYIKRGRPIPGDGSASLTFTMFYE